MISLASYVTHRYGEDKEKKGNIAIYNASDLQNTATRKDKEY